MQFIVMFVSILIDLLSFAIIGRVLFSWIGPQHQRGQIYMILVDVTDPVLNLIKKYVPNMGMLDFSPLIALIGLDLLRRVFLSLIA